MRKLMILAAVAGVLFHIVSCGKSLSGKYVSVKNSAAIVEFADGKVIIHKQGLPYEIQGNKVYVNSNGARYELFEIVDSETLKDKLGLFKKVK